MAIGAWRRCSNWFPCQGILWGCWFSSIGCVRCKRAGIGYCRYSRNRCSRLAKKYRVQVRTRKIILQHMSFLDTLKLMIVSNFNLYQTLLNLQVRIPWHSSCDYLVLDGYQQIWQRKTSSSVTVCNRHFFNTLWRIFCVAGIKWTKEILHWKVG